MSWFCRMPSRCTLKKKVRLGREFGQLLADEHAVGAEDDDFLPLLDLGHELADARIDHRLAAADRDDRRTALVDGGQAFLDRQLLLDRRFVFADSPAAGARQVAGVQRLEHENHGEFLGSRQSLASDIAGDAAGHRQRKKHEAGPPGIRQRDCPERCRDGRCPPTIGTMPAGCTHLHRHRLEIQRQRLGRDPARQAWARLARAGVRWRPGTAPSPSVENTRGKGDSEGRRRVGKPVPVNWGSSHEPSGNWVWTR